MPTEPLTLRLESGSGASRERPWTSYPAFAILAAGSTVVATPGYSDAPRVQYSAESRVISVPKTTSVDNLFDISDGYAQVEATLQRLTTMHVGTELKLEKLALEVAGLHARLQPTETSAEYASDPVIAQDDIERAIKAAAATDDVMTHAELLDVAADHEFRSDELLSEAIKGIETDDAFTRASAARLLAVNDPLAAREILPKIIDGEPSVTAKSIMRAALRSIAA